MQQNVLLVFLLVLFNTEFTNQRLIGAFRMFFEPVSTTKLSLYGSNPPRPRGGVLLDNA